MRCTPVLKCASCRAEHTEYPRGRCRVTYVGHGDGCRLLGCAHRRAPAPPIRSIYRVRRSVHGVGRTGYSSRRERRDCDIYMYHTCTYTCTGSVYMYHTLNPAWPQCTLVRAAVPRGGPPPALHVVRNCSVFIEFIVRLVSASIVMPMCIEHSVSTLSVSC